MLSTKGTEKIKPLIIILLLIPSFYWAYLLFVGNLGVNPIEKLMDNLGEMALRLIIFTLFISSLSEIKYFRSLIAIRRTIGLFALYCDYSIYNFLLTLIDMDLAKGASTFVGVNISFHLNRVWTFKSKARYFDDLKRYIALYTLTIAVNVYTNKVAYMILEDINAAYFIALFISVTIGYFGQRLWVFKNR